MEFFARQKHCPARNIRSHSDEDGAREDGEKCYCQRSPQKAFQFLFIVNVKQSRLIAIRLLHWDMCHFRQWTAPPLPINETKEKTIDGSLWILAHSKCSRKAHAFNVRLPIQHNYLSLGRWCWVSIACFAFTHWRTATLHQHLTVKYGSFNTLTAKTDRKKKEKIVLNEKNIRNVSCTTHHPIEWIPNGRMRNIWESKVFVVFSLCVCLFGMTSGKKSTKYSVSGCANCGWKTINWFTIS